MEIDEIYVDNYRNFYNSTIPLKNTTFLVGENSSGKTSLLKLLDLVYGLNFWITGAFRNDNVDLSYYGDIANNKSDSLTTIGISYRFKIDDDKIENEYAKIKLISGINSQTTISEIQLQFRGYRVDIVNDYKSNEVSYSLLKLDKSNNSFAEFCNSTVLSRDLQQLPDKGSFSVSSGPYFTVNRIIAQHNLDKKDDVPEPHIFDSFISSTWIAPIREKPKLTYDGNIYSYSPDGAHAPYRLLTIYDKRKSKSSREILKALEQFGKDSKLFDSILAKRYSKEGNAPFTIDIVRDGETRHITEVGYGVSQVLPIVISILSARFEQNFIIQQPEVHLHPRAQASLGGFLYDIRSKTNASFLVETHSDFVIDRYRQRMSESRQKNKASAEVIYFEHTLKGNVAHTIAINSDGSYSDEQPDSFRSFFLDEQIKNLKI